MFSLLNGFYEYYTRRPSFNILIIGLDSAGKTTLLEQIKKILTGKEMSLDTIPTVGLNVSKCNFNGVQCQFWDLGGGGDLPKLWKKYYVEAHAVFFVIDSLKIETERLNQILDEFRGNDDSDGVPVAVLANKQDLIAENIESLVKIKEIFNPLMLKIEARESKVFGVSALKGTGVIEVLEWSLSVIEKNSEQRPPNFV